MNTTTIRLSAQELPAVENQVIDVYREAFGQAPYYKDEADVRLFTKNLPRHMQREGFRCTIVRNDTTGHILGFAYGYTGMPGQWWHDLVARKMQKDMVALWMADVFEVVEVAVRPSMQGHGFGGQVHDALLQQLPHRTATLSTYQTETTGLKMYQKRGWVTLLDNFMFPGYTEPYRIMGLKLP